MARLSQPNAGPQARTIEVDGIGRVEVSPNFFDLPADQQQQVVAEIVADYGAQRQEAPQQAQPAQPAPQQPETFPTGMPTVIPGIDLADVVGAAQGVGHVLDNAAELAQGAYNNTLGHVFGESNSATETNQAGLGFEGLANQPGQGTERGRFVGETGAAALLTRGLGGPLMQGAGTGALMSEADSPGDFIRDTAIGAAGGVIGDRLVRGATAVLDPVIERGAQLLGGAGVRMTPGQYLPALREFEDKSMSLPFAGPQITAARREGFQDFARAIPREALDTVRARLPHRGIPAFADDVTGQQAVRHTGDQLSAIYEDVIPQLRLQADAPLLAEIQGISQRLQAEPLSDAGREQFERVIRRGIITRMRGNAASGQDYQAADSYLEQQAARFGRSSDPDHQIIADGIRDIRASLRNGIVRQNGSLGEELEAVDEAWSMLVPAEEAASQAVRGFFSPAQYRQALRRGDARVRRRGMARGEVRGQEMAEAGQDILPPQMPNPSGTAGHEAYSIGNARFWQGLGTRMLYGPPVQNALRVGTIDRPAALDPLARAVGQTLNALQAPQAGAIGAQAVVNPLLGY